MAMFFMCVFEAAKRSGSLVWSCRVSVSCGLWTEAKLWEASPHSPTGILQPRLSFVSWLSRPASCKSSCNNQACVRRPRDPLYRAIGVQSRINKSWRELCSCTHTHTHTHTQIHTHNRWTKATAYGSSNSLSSSLSLSLAEQIQAD